MKFPFRSHRISPSSEGFAYLPHYPRPITFNLPIIDSEEFSLPVLIQPFYMIPDVLLDMLNTKTFQIEAEFVPSELDGFGPIVEATPRKVDETINNGSVWYKRENEPERINEDGFLSLADVYENYLPDTAFEDFPDARSQWPCGLNYLYSETFELEETEYVVNVSFNISPPTSMGQAINLDNKHFWFHRAGAEVNASISDGLNAIDFSSGHVEINGEMIGEPSPGFPVVKITSTEYF
jgi:hypothetical protein